jgi:tetratricopeptide (TPR) repeat protein
MNRSTAIRIVLLCYFLATFLPACSRDPNLRKQKYFSSGEKYFYVGKYHEAVIQYENAIQIDPSFVSAHAKLAQALLKVGDNNKAFQELNRAVELDPDNTRSRTDLANLLMTVRSPDGSLVPEVMKQAKVQLDWLDKNQPNNAETHQALANYYSAENDLASATREAQRSVDLDPSRSGSYLMLALLQTRLDLPEQAESNFKKSIEIDPKALKPQLALGEFYQSRNRFSEAERQFGHTIELFPKEPEARIALVRSLLQVNKTYEAESVLKQSKADLRDNPEGYRILGDFYFAIGDVDKAANEYSSVSHDHPRDLQARKNFIQLLILRNRLQEASALNNDILKNSPHDVDALIYKGQIQLRGDNAAAAIESFQAALRNDAQNPVAHYQLGLAFAQLRNPSRAESEWREAVLLRPEFTSAQQALASLDIERGNMDSVLERAQQIIAAEPYSSDGFLLKAVAECARQRFADAQRDAEQAMKWAPRRAAPYIELANIQFAQKHFADAQKLYQNALERDPDSAEGLSGLMDSYFSQKQVDEAIAAANAQIAKAPNVSNFYDLLGTALYIAKNDYAGAEAMLRKAVDLDKTNVDALEKLGKVQVQEGASDRALALYLQSIKDNPREARLYVLAGELYEARGNWNQAEAMYREALEISPDYPLASNNLAYIMLERDENVDLAMNMAQTARRGMPDSSNAADTLGWAYYRKGIYQSAISQFREALRLNKTNGRRDDSVLHYHLGLAYQKAKQMGLARQELERALQLNPRDEDARKALSELRS